MCSKALRHLVHVQIFDKVDISLHLFELLGISNRNFLLSSLAMALEMLLWVMNVHLLIICLFLSLHEWNEDGIVSAKRLSVILQVFFEKLGPELPI